MGKTLVIDMVDLTDKWDKLLLWMQKSTTNIYRCRFPDRKEASHVRRVMNDAIIRRPTWFKLLIIQRDSNVYIVKLAQLQKVELRYD